MDVLWPGTIVASVAVVAAGISFAAIPSADGTIHGCYKKTTRVLRVINAESGQTCAADERSLTWNQEGLTGSPGPAGTGTVAEVATASGPSLVTRSTSAIDWQALAGAEATVTVPPGETGMILARFTAESSCSASGSAANYCAVRIMVNGTEAKPAAGSDFSFDSHGDRAEALGIERELTSLDPGVYQVQVQWTGVPVPTDGGMSTFTLDDWHLTVERLVE